MAVLRRANSAAVRLMHSLAMQRPRAWMTLSLLTSVCLVAYSYSGLPGHYLGTPVALAILYLNVTLLYLRIQIERNTELRTDSERITKAMETALSAERHQRAAEFARRDSKWYQTFSRVLTPEDERLFCTFWGEALGLTITASHLRYLQHRISQVENLCQGRLACSVQDAILRLLVARAVSGDHLRVLEIGTLFGVNAIVIHDAASCFFRSVSVVLIDPLDGYYGADNVDANTGLCVTKDILQRNFDRLMIPPTDYHIVQEYSSSPAAAEQASQQNYNLIFIDGDHSYEGVKKDFELYSHLLEHGGYLVFDDYQAPSWPGVQQAVDESVLNSSLYEHIGASWRSIVFRKK